MPWRDHLLGRRLDRDAGGLYAELLALPGARRLSDVASVDIGVVTGANRFFILETKEAERLRLPASQLLPVIESASAVTGLTVYPSRTKRLLAIDREPRSRSLLHYLAAGEAAGVSQGYKCRTRSPWYRVPLPTVKPHAFLPYMNHHAPRLLVNWPRAWSTNLLHGVTLRRGAPDLRAISAAMLSATAMLSAEIEGRAYGGGVLKLETKEAEHGKTHDEQNAQLKIIEERGRQNQQDIQEIKADTKDIQHDIKQMLREHNRRGP